MYQTQIRFCCRASWLVIAALISGGGDSVLASSVPPPEEQADLLSDPYFKYQWHLSNTGQPIRGRRGKRDVDLRVMDVWQNIKGRGSKIAIVDDGLDISHPNLVNNILHGFSHNYDYRRNGKSRTDPTPTKSKYAHGTKVAGVAAAAQNGTGIVGVAPEAKLVGFNLLAGKTTIRKIMDALTRGSNARTGNIDISNNSWGGPPTGTVVNGHMVALRTATQWGVNYGRNHKGMIYLFAAGNERYGANNIYYPNPGYGWANFDQTRAPQILTVCSIDANGRSSYYSDFGSNLLVCGLSGGESTAPQIATTLPNTARNLYTFDFSGNSAATPMVSGVIALMLEANPSLTWRDVRLILARTARILPQMKHVGSQWVITQGLNPYPDPTRPRHYQYSPLYGFGLVDAKAAVDYARRFNSVGGSNYRWWLHPLCKGSSSSSLPVEIPYRRSKTVEIPMTTCGNGKVEFAEIEVGIEHPRFRDLKVILQTPKRTAPDGTIVPGTEIPLTEYYDHCGSNPIQDSCPTADFGHVYRTSVTAPLDELASGNWRLSISDEGYGTVRGKLNSVKLTIR